MPRNPCKSRPLPLCPLDPPESPPARTPEAPTCRADELGAAETEAAAAKVARRLAEMPSKCRGLYRDVMTGRRASPRRAIAAHCQMCVGWEDYAERIRTCTDPACPLYPFRPYRRKGGGE